MIQRRDVRSGFMLIFVVGTLAVLSVLATGLVYTTMLDRSIASNYAAGARAKLAAESGVAFAVSVIHELPAGPLREDDVERLAYEDPTRPVGNVAPPGWDCRVSGVIGDCQTVLHSYTVNIEEESSKLNLNDDDEELPLPKDHPLAGRTRLEACVAELCRCWFEGDGIALDPSRVAWVLFRDPRLGRGNLPGGRFAHVSQVEAALTAAGLTPEQIADFRRFTTLHSWQDPDVLRPAPYANIDEPVDTWLSFQARTFACERRAPVNVNTARPELLEALLRPLEGVWLEEGPAERQSMEHYGWWSTGIGPVDESALRMGTVRATSAFTPEQANRLAMALIDRIHARQINADLQAHAQGMTQSDPFETWEEFRVFLEKGLTPDAEAFIFDGGKDDEDVDRPRPPAFVDPHLADDPGDPRNEYFTRGISTQDVNLQWYSDSAERREWWRRYRRQAQKDLVYANANPNSLLNDWNPNEHVFLRVDKAQLRVNTTEFCFAPTGVFRVRSRGEVRLPAGVVASCAIDTDLRAFVQLRLTTQAQFMRGLDSVADMDRFFSREAPKPGGSGNWQYQSAQAVAGVSYGLQSYPEPNLWRDPQTLSVRPSRFDGNLQLVTHTFDPVDWGFGIDFDGFDRFNNCRDALRLRYAQAGGPHDNPACLVDAVNRPHAGPLTGDWDPRFNTPGNVYPDGAYSEKGRTLAYRLWNFDDPNIQSKGRIGMVGFWIKPNFHMGISSRIRKFVAGPGKPGRYARQSLFSVYYLSNPGSNQTNGAYAGPMPGPLDAFSPATAYACSYRNYWIPPRCLAAGLAWNSGDASGTHDVEVDWDEEGNPITAPESNYIWFWRGQHVSPTLAQDAPVAYRDTALPPDLQYHWRGRCWNHAWVSWNASPSFENGAFLTYINGKGVNWNRRGTTTFYHPLAYAPLEDFREEWLRFGELAPGADRQTGAESPYYADATFDQIWGSGWNGSGGVLGVPFRAGRYLSRPVSASGARHIASYTSPDLSPWVALGLSRHRRLQFRDAAWTLYRPKNNRVFTPNSAWVSNDDFQDNVQGISVNTRDTPDPTAAEWAGETSIPAATKSAWDPLSMDLLNGDGRWLFDETVPNGGTRRLTYAGGSDVPEEFGGGPRYAYGDEIRVRAFFHLADNQHLYESPVLDDVTLTFWLDRPDALVWTERHL